MGVFGPGVGSFGYGAMHFKSSQSAGSFKMKRFEIFCSDPFTHQPVEWPERYAAPRASLDVAVRAGTKQTTPRGLGARLALHLTTATKRDDVVYWYLIQ